MPKLEIDLSNIIPNGIILILLGLVIILFGYWTKWHLYYYSTATDEVKETIQGFREKIVLGKKVSLNQRLNIWFIDGFGVKFFNKIGFAIISIGILLSFIIPIIVPIINYIFS